MSIEKEDEGRDSPMVESSSHKEEYKKSPEYKKVYHIRHRLQRLVYNKKEASKSEKKKKRNRKEKRKINLFIG